MTPISAMQIVEVVFAQVDAVEQDLAFGGIVEARDQLDDGGFALAVFADQGDALAGPSVKLKLLEDAPVGPGIGEGDIAEFEAARIGRARAARSASIRRAASSQRRPAGR